MTESLIALAIILVVATFATPVINRARQSAQISSSLSRLQQLHLAVSMYRQENEGGGTTWYGLGLPPFGYVYGTYMGFPQDFFRSPCGYKEGLEENQLRLSYQYTIDGDPDTDRYLERYGENALLFRDVYCNPDARTFYAKFATKRGLGVLLSGKTVNLMKKGDGTKLEWWSSPP